MDGICHPLTKKSVICNKYNNWDEKSLMLERSVRVVWIWCALFGSENDAYDVVEAIQMFEFIYSLYWWRRIWNRPPAFKTELNLFFSSSHTKINWNSALQYYSFRILVKEIILYCERRPHIHSSVPSFQKCGTLQTAIMNDMNWKTKNI